MGTLLLGHLARAFNWIANKLEDVISYPEDYFLAEELGEIHRAYLNGAKVEQVAERYPNIHPELIHLLFEKLAHQNGCLTYMDRAFVTLMK